MKEYVIKVIECCGCLIFSVVAILTVTVQINPTIGSIVGVIMAVLLVLAMIGNFLGERETRNKIKENIGKLDKLNAVFAILKNVEKKEFHNFIITQLAKINELEKINLICQECFKTRNPLLIKLIVKKNWIASEPVEVKVYTILKTNQLNLIDTADGEIVKYLLEFLQDQDSEIADNSLKILVSNNLMNQEKINYLCKQWIKDKEEINTGGNLYKQGIIDREKRLEKIIIGQKYIATYSLEATILTALKTEQLSLIKNETEKGVKYLLEFLQDQDSQIAGNSIKVLNNLINQEGINYLCKQWIKNREKTLEKIIIEQKYIATYSLEDTILTALKTEQFELLSNLNLEEIIILMNTFDDTDLLIASNAQKMGDFLQNPISKSLMYFITEQWQKYEQIDFDQNILKNIFYHGDDLLRKKITEKIKISGRSDWLQVIFAEGKRKNVELMTDYDWQVTVELLSKTDNDQEKWKLAQQAPPFYSQQLLKQIHSLNFINGEKSYQQNLLNLGKKVIPNLSDLIPWINDNSETATFHLGQTKPAMNSEVTLLACGSYKTITLWELPSKKLLNTFRTYDYGLYRLTMNKEGTLLACSYYDTVIKLWELPSGRLRGTSVFTRVNTCLVMNQEGTLLASGSSDNTIKLWKLPSFSSLTLTGHTAFISSLVINEEGTLLASGSYKTIKLWELPSGKLLNTLTGHTHWIDCLVMNREGTLLASGSNDKTIKLWELPSGKLLNTLTGHTDEVSRLVMNSEGTLLASDSNHTIKLWELPSGRLLNTLTGHTDGIDSLVMNREGTLLASCSHDSVYDNTLKLWKLYSLDRLPLSKIISHYDWIQDNLKRDDLNKNQRNWFEFILALVNNYRRFEIDVEDAPIINDAGKFDIEIEG